MRPSPSSRLNSEWTCRWTKSLGAMGTRGMVAGAWSQGAGVVGGRLSLVEGQSTAERRSTRRPSRKLEAETVLHDLQALDRRIARKMKDDGVDRVVLLVADTRRNRRVIREFQALIRERYPLSTREVMTALSSGRLPRASGYAVI